MRILYALFSVMFLVSAYPAAAASCRITVGQALASSPYFGQGMSLTGAMKDDSATYSNVDDPRMIVTFTMTAAEPVDGLSRAEYVRRLDEYATFAANRVKAQGHWADKAVFPYDPVAWRTLEETVVQGVGDAFAGHMEIRLTPDCVLSADFISPTSPNLRSRWSQMTAAVSDIRNRASNLTVADDWMPDDTTPTGITALAGGFVSPVGVIGLIYLLLGQIRRLDPPGMSTRVVLGSCAALAAGCLAYQVPAYREAFRELRYLDNALLLSFVALTCLAGALMAQRAAILGLLSASVAGIALSVASGFGWTPDVNVSFVTGAGLILMGVLGFYAWSEGSGRGTPLPPSA